jgi:uncharacterized protein (TIGR02145 family)
MNNKQMENKMDKFTKIALTASLGLAITFTFSCSGDDGDNPPLAPAISSSGGSSSSHPGSSSSVLLSSSSSSRLSSSSTQSGIVYGVPVSYEGETYQTVVIGSQTWMARNLNYAVEGSKCYGNSEANCATYGRLYDWATAMALPGCGYGTSCGSQIGSKHKGICPSGWHLPSDAEWDVLITTVGGSSTAGTKLKATSGWNDYNGASGGTDSYGFSALPGGLGSSGGNFYFAGNDGYWWSSTEGNDYYANFYANFRYMYNINESVRWDSYYKDDLFSVRCLQD